VVDAQDKLAGLIRRAIEDEAGMELVTRPGKPTPRGGYQTTWMFAQRGTATALTIHAAWYPDSASFTLTGPAVDQADGEFWTARRLYRSREHLTYGTLQCHIFVQFADGPVIDRLLAALPALLAPGRAGTRFTVDRRELVRYLNRARRRHRYWASREALIVPEPEPIAGEEFELPRDWNPRSLDRDDVYDPHVLIEEAVAAGVITCRPGVTLAMTVEGAETGSYDACYGWQVTARGVGFDLADTGYQMKYAGDAAVGVAAAAALIYEAEDKGNQLLGRYETAAGRPLTPVPADARS
jgi:hypothetical protein